MRYGWLLLLIGCAGHAGERVATPAPLVASSAPREAAKAPALSTGGTSLCAWNDWRECEQRCGDGNALSCARWGHLLQRGAWRHQEDKLAADPKKARDAYRRGCDLGYMGACNLLGVLLADGVGGDKDEPAAFAMFERACAGAFPFACANVAAGTDDPAKAKTMYERACALGDAESCIDAGERKGDLKGALAGFTRAMKGAPTPSVLAAARVKCIEGTIAVLTQSGIGGLGGPETFCSRDGKKEGPSIEWLSMEDLVEGPPHGVATEVATYKNDRRDGHFASYHESGTLRREGNYVAGREEGVWKELVSNGEEGEEGTFVDGKKQGVWKEWRPGWRRETEWSAGKKNGSSITYLDGNKYEEKHFTDDKQTGDEITTWSNGQKCIYHYEADRRDGLGQCWHPNKTKMSESHWSRGSQQGTSRSWYENGQLEAQGEYANQKRVGHWIVFHSNGRKYKEGDYDRDGQEIGTWRRWDENGKPE